MTVLMRIDYGPLQKISEVLCHDLTPFHEHTNKLCIYAFKSKDTIIRVHHFAVLVVKCP